MANNDPILTPLIISAAAAGGITLTATTAAWISSLIVAGTLVGLSLILAPRPPSPGDGSTVFKQPIPPRVYFVGTTRLAGFYLWVAERDGDLYVVTAITDEEVAAVEQVYLNDDPVEVVGNVVQPGEDGRYGGGNVTLATLRGQAGVPAFPPLATVFPEIDDNFTGTGIYMLFLACVGVKQEDHLKIYPNNDPKPSVVVSAARRWDPRDPAQDPEDPGTWSASTKNLVLNWLYFECFCPNGPRKNYLNAIMPYVDVWKEEADICDELVDTADGAQVPRYEIGYWWHALTGEETIRAMFLACCDGWTCNLPDGGFIVRVGKYREPTVTLTDDDLTTFFIQRDQNVEDRVNELIIKYTSPEHDYGEVEADPFRDEAQIAKDGRLLNTSVDLWGVQNRNQARRLGLRDWNRQNEGVRGSAECNIGGFGAIGQRWVRVQSDRIPRMSNTVIELRSGDIDPVGGSFTFMWIRSGPHIDIYDPNDPDWGDGAAPPAKVRPGTFLPETPTDLQGEIVDHGDGQHSFNLNWEQQAKVSTGTPREDLDYLVRYRLQDDGDGDPGPWKTDKVTDPTVVGDRVFTVIFPTIMGVEYDVQVAAVGPRGTRSDWSDTLPLVTANVMLREDGSTMLREDGSFFFREA